MPKVTVIPSTINPITQLPHNTTTLKKVAAYARVSTNSDEQYTSYEAQVTYYKKFIEDKPDWEYINVYADEGLSGTNTKRRVSFNKMITDALNGKINLIITKSISRFARNTLDTISFVRKLKDNGVEVFFEKENLWTMDPKSELILTIMASIAQEESRSISQNVTWGKRVAFQQGKVSFAYKSFLGYKKENDKILIDEDQAEIVRMIYRMFLVEGKTATGIVNYLKSKHIKTPTGKTANWTKNTVNSILTNEKYKGDALLQRTYTENYLDHKIVKNNGQIPQYYVENNHPAIIDREMWDQVQIELERREQIGAQYSSSDVFASKLICEDCGGFYGKKKWHSNSKYSRFIYQCNNKFHKHKDKCLTPNLKEEDIKLKFLKAYNLVMEDKRRIIQDSEEIIELLTGSTKLDDEIRNMDDELSLTADLVSILVKENSKTSHGLDDYNKKYEELSSRYDKLQTKREELLKQRNDRQGQVLRMKAFIASLSKSEDELSDWNERIWMLLVDGATVHRDLSITFKFHNGIESKIR
ncbi:recombinase family protein [Liberiplasma polymorphum]|uniref:recombinase family protein n=1 Tax=Liberiplasma polymorphum TaxID=3374570 RepID=UPI003770F130